MTLATPLTETLDLDVPVVQAPIGSATCPDLAAAVADAGALGMLAVTWRDETETRAVVRETRARTDGPFGVNLVVDPAARTVPVERQVTAALDEGVDVVSFSFGVAEAQVDRVHDAGATVFQSVGSADAAREAVDAGADVVVAQGWEAGGHVESEVATMPLVPRVVDAAPETPVVAAGGVADGRGVAAALALGADGAWLGTRFLATEEARVHEAYRERVVDADETATVFGTVYDEGWPGTPHRVIENETVGEWRAWRERRGARPTREQSSRGQPATPSPVTKGAGHERSGEQREPWRSERHETGARDDSDRPGEGEVVAEGPDGDPIGRYEDSLATPGTTGDVERLPLYAGQSVGLTDEVRPAGAVVRTLAAELEAAVDRFDESR